MDPSAEHVQPYDAVVHISGKRHHSVPHTRTATFNIHQPHGNTLFHQCDNTSEGNNICHATHIYTQYIKPPHIRKKQCQTLQRRVATQNNPELSVTFRTVYENTITSSLSQAFVFRQCGRLTKPCFALVTLRHGMLSCRATNKTSFNTKTYKTIERSYPLIPELFWYKKMSTWTVTRPPIVCMSYVSSTNLSADDILFRSPPQPHLVLPIPAAEPTPTPTPNKRK